MISVNTPTKESEDLSEITKYKNEKKPISFPSSNMMPQLQPQIGFAADFERGSSKNGSYENNIMQLFHG